MGRRIFSGFFLLLLLVSGSGIGYLFSIHLARSNARRFACEIHTGSYTVENISMTAEEFNSLEKEKISSTIFEITYKGRRFDIYKTEKKDNTIILSARHDKQEEAAMKNMASSHGNKKLNQQTPPFYSFHYFIPENLYYNSNSTEIHYTVLSGSNNFMNHCRITSPPPDTEFV